MLAAFALYGFLSNNITYQPMMLNAIAVRKNRISFLPKIKLSPIKLTIVLKCTMTKNRSPISRSSCWKTGV